MPNSQRGLKKQRVPTATKSTYHKLSLNHSKTFINFDFGYRYVLLVA